MLTWKEIRIRYKQSVMGFLWAILMPIMIVGAGMLMNAPLSALAHASYNSERGALLDLMQQGGLRAFLEARDGAFRPEPFGPKSAPKTP